MGIILVENFFYPTSCGNFFLVIKNKPPMHFDIPKKNCSPKIEKFHCYVHRFAVFKVDRPRATPFPKFSKLSKIYDPDFQPRQLLPSNQGFQHSTDCTCCGFGDISLLLFQYGHSEIIEVRCQQLPPGPDIGHILFLRILYHIPYHGPKSDVISYPISRLKQVGNPTSTTSQLKTRDSKDSARA
jgi:hypothetical protein